MYKKIKNSNEKEMYRSGILFKFQYNDDDEKTNPNLSDIPIEKTCCNFILDEESLFRS
jgi:hypothetical protein